MRIYTLKFFGLSAVLALLALAVGNSGQAEIAQPSTQTSDPMIWFAPLDPIPRPISPEETRIGSVDFMNLFKEDAPWTKAASRVHVFKFYGQFPAPWLSGPTDAQLQQVMADLNRRGIAIALEMGSLTANDSCGKDVEGFDGIEAGLILARRIQAAGGVLRYVAMDEPFFYGSLYDGPNACRWSPEKIARDVSAYVQGLKGVFPDVVVGDVEPLTPNAGVQQYESWLNTYRTVTGSNLPFFHADVDWSRPDWPQDVKELETFARERGIPFGIIYNGDETDPSDEAWLRHAEDRMALYESLTGGKPDHVIFQSWHDKPDYTLPETAPNTFTHLINRYFRTRTQINLMASPPSSDGLLQVTGSLTDVAGKPISNAPVELSVASLSGPGQFAEYTVSGVVPAGATQGIVGFRVNNECGCSGTSEFFLYEARYVQGNETTNRVANGSFSQGLQGWGFWGTGTARLELSDRGGSGTMLHVKSTATQSASINSTTFPVTAGATYTATFAARVAPVSVGSGYFAVFLLEPSGEGRRDTIPLEPTTITNKTSTDGSGAYRFSLQGIPAASLKLRVKYLGVEFPGSAGDQGYWPAYAEKLME